MYSGLLLVLAAFNFCSGTCSARVVYRCFLFVCTGCPVCAVGLLTSPDWVVTPSVTDLVGIVVAT